MPADARQEVERLPGVHCAAPQKVAAATTVCAFFKAMAFHQPRIVPRQCVSARSLALYLARLLRGMTCEPFGCDRKFTHVFVGVTSKELVRDVRDIDRIINRHFVVH
jgi:hypothetical protein